MGNKSTPNGVGVQVSPLPFLFGFRGDAHISAQSEMDIGIKLTEHNRNMYDEESSIQQIEPPLQDAAISCLTALLRLQSPVLLLLLLLSWGHFCLSSSACQGKRYNATLE